MVWYNVVSAFVGLIFKYWSQILVEKHFIDIANHKKGRPLSPGVLDVHFILIKTKSYEMGCEGSG